jgi:16S rRNA (cytidine1402-2'-O)-methyltransferase
MSELYIVSTPIGNLKDITLRALEILQSVDFIACEDTRVTAFLLNHYSIKKEMISLNAANEVHKINYIIERIKSGEKCALVSDAGTPGISDPGTRLISAAVREELTVVSVPGVTAAIAALTLSGFPTDAFLFEGFLPQKKGRQKKLMGLAAEERTIIIYESPYRIEKLLNELNQYMPDRMIVAAREITKKFEEVWRGTAADLIAKGDKMIKGEFVLIIAPPGFHR